MAHMHLSMNTTIDTHETHSWCAVTLACVCAGTVFDAPHCRTGVRQYLHRMVVCLDSEILPFVPVAMERLMKHADAKELYDFIPLINQLVCKFKVSTGTGHVTNSCKWILSRAAWKLTCCSRVLAEADRSLPAVGFPADCDEDLRGTERADGRARPRRGVGPAAAAALLLLLHSDARQQQRARGAQQPGSVAPPVRQCSTWRNNAPR